VSSFLEIDRIGAFVDVFVLEIVSVQMDVSVILLLKEEGDDDVEAPISILFGENDINRVQNGPKYNVFIIFVFFAFKNN